MSDRKILIVDDDEITRRMLSVRLDRNGYQTLGAPDGVTALAIARSERPDAILLDLGLPGGDGFLVLERLKNIPGLAEIPVIVVTARQEGANRSRALAAGAVGFVQKPVDARALVEVLETNVATRVGG